MPPNDQDANDVLMGGGVKPAEFHTVGTTVGGLIVFKPKSYHVREYDKNNPGGGALAYFPSGDPIMGINVDVKSNARDPGDPNDDGTRRLYLDKARQLAAVRLAVRAVGAAGLEQGGYLAVTLTGSEEGKGSMPAHTWSAVYRPASTPIPGGPGPAPQAQQAPVQQYTQPVTGDPWQAAPAPQVVQPVQYQPPTQQAPVPQAVPAGPAAQVITETVASAMRNAGIDTSMFTVVPG